MKRVIKYVGVGLILISLMGGGLLSCKAPTAPTEPTELPLGEPIKLGLIVALTGECSVWGLPQFRALEIYQDYVNNDLGGIVAGGERHLIDFKGYDNICYIPSEELKAAKKAILVDDRKFLIQAEVRSCEEILAPFVTEHKVLTLCWGGTYTRPEYPYSMKGSTMCPGGFPAIITTVAELHPEIESIAILTTDSFPEYQPWQEIGARAANLDIVYNEIIPIGTYDFRPIFTAIMATGADLVTQGCTVSQGTYFEAPYLLDYTGYIISDNFMADQAFARVPLEYLEGRAYTGMTPDFSDPYFTGIARLMSDLYYEKHRMREDPNWAGVIDQCELIRAGIEAADSIDPTDVMNTLYAMSVVDHPVYGESGWGGIEQFGVNHQLATPVPVMEVKGLSTRIVSWVSIVDWWEEHGDLALEVLDEYGMLYHPGE